MTAKDRTAALRNRRGHTNASVDRRASRPATGRPADLVVTADMIPDPVRVEAAGDLSRTEIHDLGTCEKAVDNLTTARWLAGKALQSIRDRRLYRATHSTFKEYVQARWEMSESAAYQAIEEWPLAERLQQHLGKPATPSHTRALLPVAHRFGLDPAVELYRQLGTRAAADGLTMTAALTARVVRAILQQTGTEAQAPQFQEAARQLMSAKALPTSETPKQRNGSPPRSVPMRSDDEKEDEALPDARRSTGEAVLQNFGGDHGEVTALGAEIPAPDPSGTPDYSSESPSPEAVIRILKHIRQKVQDVEDAIESLAVVDPSDDGEAEDLRQDIRQRLLSAAEHYKPFRTRT